MAERGFIPTIPAGYEDPEKDEGQEQPEGEGGGGLFAAKIPEGYEDPDEGKPLYAGRPVGDETPAEGGSISQQLKSPIQTAMGAYGLKAPGKLGSQAPPIGPVASHAPNPQAPVFGPLPRSTVSKYEPPSRKGPEWDPSLATPVPSMQRTEIENQPITSAAEQAIKTLPPTPGTLPYSQTPLTPESKAALRATPKDTSLFAGKAPGQNVETTPGNPQTLVALAEEAMGPEWRRTAEDIYGKLPTAILKGTGEAIASFEDSMGSAENLAIIGGLHGVAKYALAKWGPVVAKNISRLADIKFSTDIASALSKERMDELGEAIVSKDPEKMAKAVAGALMDAAMLVHPTRDAEGKPSLGGMIPGAVEGLGATTRFTENQNQNAAKRQEAQDRAAALAGWAGRAEAQRQNFPSNPAEHGLRGIYEQGLGEGAPVDTTGTPMGRAGADLGTPPPVVEQPPTTYSGENPVGKTLEPPHAVPVEPSPFDPEPARLEPPPPVEVAPPAPEPPVSRIPAPEFVPRQRPAPVEAPAPAPAAPEAAPEVRPEPPPPPGYEEVTEAPEAPPKEAWGPKGEIARHGTKVLEGKSDAEIETAAKEADIEARAKAMEAEVREKAEKGSLKERAQAKATLEAATPEDWREAARQEAQEHEAARTEREPDQGAENAPAGDREADQKHGEAADTGERLPEHEPPVQGARPSEPAPGGRAGGGAEAAPGPRAEPAEQVDERTPQVAIYGEPAGGMQFIVRKMKDGRFGVQPKDPHSGELDQSVRIYPTELWARAAAKNMASGKEPGPNPETKPGWKAPESRRDPEGRLPGDKGYRGASGAEETEIKKAARSERIKRIVEKKLPPPPKIEETEKGFVVSYFEDIGEDAFAAPRQPKQMTFATREEAEKWVAEMQAKREAKLRARLERTSDSDLEQYEGEAHVEAPQQETRPVGARGEPTMEAGRPEAPRGADQVGEAPRGTEEGGGRRSGPRAPSPESGVKPPRGPAQREGTDAPVRPGERADETGAVGERAGATERAGGDEQAVKESAAQGANALTGKEGVPILSEHQGAGVETTPSHTGGDFRYASTQEAEAHLSLGPRARLAANFEAIQLLKNIQLEGRHATPEEQALLAKFTGFGSFPGLFKPGSDIYDMGEKVREIIGHEAFYKLNESVLNAHYTSAPVVAGMWEMAKRLGVKGGRVLEPSMGSGNFFSLMPHEIRGKARLTGVELDTTTGGIAKLLFPNANVEIKGYEELRVPDGFFDFAIGNVPFGEFKVHDKAYNKHQANIHDYFFLKTIDKVRPGGAVMFVTSTGTMNKVNTSIREALIEKGADLVAAFRLPAKTFGKSSGTDVVTDIVILKKRFPGEPPGGEAWTQLGTVPDPAGGRPIDVNEYFIKHPENVLGIIDRKNKMFPGSMNVTRTDDFEERFKKAIASLPEKIIEDRKPSAAFQPEEIAAQTGAKRGGFVVQNGKLYVSDGDTMTERLANPETINRISGLIGIRDALAESYATQLREDGEAARNEARAKLNAAYDKFVKRYGSINSKENVRAFIQDPDFPVLSSLETDGKKTGDAFTMDTVRSLKEITTADSPASALAVSLKEKGSADIERMAELLGTTEAELGKKLVENGVAYDDPNTGWTPASIYLAGNVRRKLAEAQAAARMDPRYEPNVEALKKVQPEDKPFTGIDGRFGSPWIPVSDHVEFLRSIIGGRPHHFTVFHNPSDGSWLIDYTAQGKRTYEGRDVDTKVWGTNRAGAMEIASSLASGKPIKIYDRDGDVSVLNPEASSAANQKVQEMKEAFADWLWEEPERRERLSRVYNDTHNNIRRTEPDASHYLDKNGHYVLPGMNPNIHLSKIQADFVWRVVSSGRGLAGHEVGVGKTFSMVASAMELRRLGLANKPIITVPNSVIDGFVREARKLYPAAKIIATGESFSGKERKATIGKISTGDWDMVIMTHDNIDMLPMRPEVVQGFIHEELAELEAAIGAASKATGEDGNAIVKKLEKAKKKLKQRLEEAIESGNKEDVAYFEELGGDALFVDEAHKYKSLPVYTSRENIKGIPTSRSNRATNMAMRTRWLQEKNGGRGVVFATGTPISNTLVELYNLQRYLQPKELYERGIQSFDSWMNTFADTSTTWGVKTDGTYGASTRLNEFQNLPELAAMAAEVMDIKDAEDAGIVRPKKHESVITTPMSADQREYLTEIQHRSEAIKGKRSEKGGDNPLNIATDARKSALDYRLIDPSAPDDPNSKVNKLVENVLKLHKENPGTTQAIFSDFGVHSNDKGHSVYQDITRKLVAAGIPRDKIIDLSQVTDKERRSAVARLQSGDAWIGIGSTDKLGTGVNIQRHLYAVHHLDTPWVPASLEQRNGRAWRQGNKNTDIHIFHYSTEGSFDTFMRETVEKKYGFNKAFLNAMKSGALVPRTFRDVDSEELTPAQITAITSGEPKLLEKVQLEDDIRQIERKKRTYIKAQADLETAVAKHPQELAFREKRIEALSKDVRQAGPPGFYEESPGVWKQDNSIEAKPFSAEIDGKPYAKMGEAAKAIESLLAEKADAVRPGGELDAGTYMGFPIKLWKGEWTVNDADGVQRYHWAAKLITNASELTDQGKKDRYAGTQLGGENAAGWLASAAANLRFRTAEIAREWDQVNALNEGLEKIKAQVGGPFKQEAELAEKKERLKTVSEEVTVNLARKKAEAEAYEQSEEGRMRRAESLLRQERRRAELEAKKDAEAEPEAKRFFKRTNEGVFVPVENAKNIDLGDGRDWFVHKEGKVWNVSDGRSGLSLAHGDTKLAAVAQAKSRLAEYPEKIADAIQKGLETSGLSPRWIARGEIAPKIRPKFEPVAEWLEKKKAEHAAEAPAEPEEPETESDSMAAPKKPKIAQPKEAAPVEPGKPAPKVPERMPVQMQADYDPKTMKRIGQLTLRETLASTARKHDIDTEAMDGWSKHFDYPEVRGGPVHPDIEAIAHDWETNPKWKDRPELKKAAKELRENAGAVAWINAVETGKRSEMPEELGKFADYWRKALNERHQSLLALGDQAVKSWTLDFFPHLWKDPSGSRNWLRSILARSPLMGKESHLKKRTFPKTMDGLREGFVPVDWNPVRLGLIKLNELDRAVNGYTYLNTLHELELPKFMRNGQKLDGYRVPKDRAFAVWKSGDIDVKEAFDQKLMDQLEAYAKQLGSPVTTKRALGRGNWGLSKSYIKQGRGEIERRFAGPEFVITHEIGHQLDRRFGLGKNLRKIDGITPEMAELAKLRIGEEGAGDQAYAEYVQRPSEQVANLVHAFVHAPELAAKVAPKAVAFLKAEAAKDANLKPLLEIKPSLQIGERSMTFSAGGPVLMGGWAVPEPIADILDTHFTPSLLAGSTVFNAYRKASQALLMARLGWSAFHLGFTTGDATLSRLTAAGTFASRGHIGEALKQVAATPKVFKDIVMDNEYLKEWYKPGSQGDEIGAIVKALEMGGARARQVDLYNLGAWEGFFKDLRREGAKSIIGHPLQTTMAAVEAGSRYILNTIVPRQKFAIAGELARRELMRFQDEIEKETGKKVSFKEVLQMADPLRVKDAMARAWDSVDNRMGQVVYDNLFISRTLRDALHASIQSVGWNLGTLREIGGGMKDVKNIFKPELDVRGKALPRLSDRTAYTLMLPFFHAMISTAIQYAYTGEAPKDKLDLIFPRNGRMNPDGSPARLAPATYMKDVWAYLGGFAKGGKFSGWHGVGQVGATISHKLNPMLNMLWELAHNEDFYGTEIVDKDAPVVEQLVDLAKYLAKSVTPYAAQGYFKSRKTGASFVESAPAFLGLAPASASVSRSPAQEALVEYQRAHMQKGARTHAQAEHSDLRKDMVHAQRNGDIDRFNELAREAQDKGIMSKKEVKRLGRSSAATAMENRFKALPLDEAVKVYRMATPDEKALWAPLLKQKVAKRSGMAHIPLADRTKIVNAAREALAGAK